MSRKTQQNAHKQKSRHENYRTVKGKLLSKPNMPTKNVSAFGGKVRKKIRYYHNIYIRVRYIAFENVIFTYEVR